MIYLPSSFDYAHQSEKDMNKNPQEWAHPQITLPWVCASPASIKHLTEDMVNSFLSENLHKYLHFRIT